MNPWDKEARPCNLAGKTITHLWMGEGEWVMRLDTAEAPIFLKTDADCCSETWFDTITGLDALLNKRILSVEEIDMPEGPPFPMRVSDKPTRQESDTYYGLKITTEGGVCDIVFRNSSNGYYGGSAYIDTAVPYDWRSHTKKPVEFRPITEDL